MNKNLINIQCISYCSRAFTLAETMIVLISLGIITAITLPSIMNRYNETSARAKYKKAMAVYEEAVNKIVIENGIKSNGTFFESENSFAKENNCTNTSKYFKIAETLSDDNGTNCRFKSSDGIYWDISKIQKTIVSIKEVDLNTATANSETNSK